MVEGRTLDAQRGVAYDLLKDVFGTVESIRLTIMPANQTVALRAESESDAAVPVGLCEHQRALMFDPSDDGLEINDQNVVGVLLPLRMFARIQRDIAALLPDRRSLTGTPGRLAHEQHHDHGRDPHGDSDEHADERSDERSEAQHPASGGRT